MFATRDGLVKKTPIIDYKNFVKRDNNKGIKAIGLNEGDELIGAEISSGDDDVYLFTSDGRAIHFCEYYKDQSLSENTDEESDIQDESADDGDENVGIVVQVFVHQVEALVASAVFA